MRLESDVSHLGGGCVGINRNQNLRTQAQTAMERAEWSLSGESESWGILANRRREALWEVGGSPVFRSPASKLLREITLVRLGGLGRRLTGFSLIRALLLSIELALHTHTLSGKATFGNRSPAPPKQNKIKRLGREASVPRLPTPPNGTCWERMGSSLMKLSAKTAAVVYARTVAKRLFANSVP
jgi:hypothetical protein